MLVTKQHKTELFSGQSVYVVQGYEFIYVLNMHVFVCIKLDSR